MTNAQKKAKLLQLISLHCETAIADAEKGGGDPAAIDEIEAQFAHCSQRLFDFIQNELFAEPVKIAIPARQSGKSFARALNAAMIEIPMVGAPEAYRQRISDFVLGWMSARKLEKLNAKD